MIQNCSALAVYGFTTAVLEPPKASVSTSRHTPDASRSPRPDGLDREADLLASANASDCSTEEERAGASLAMATGRVEEPEEEAEADSCGYEGDVGEGKKKLAASSRRGSAISHPHPGFSMNRVRFS